MTLGQNRDEIKTILLSNKLTPDRVCCSCIAAYCRNNVDNFGLFIASYFATRLGLLLDLPCPNLLKFNQQYTYNRVSKLDWILFLQILAKWIKII